MRDEPRAGRVNGATGRDGPSGPALIRLRRLTRRFGATEAVRGIDLDVRAGEVFGFLGPNGAGKSTTIRILCTLSRPTSGTATVAGFDTVREPLRVRSRIGVVFQDSSLDEKLTARENLRLHSLAYDIPRGVARQRIEEALEVVELSERAASLVRTFSGGMRRRLEIARGILHRPSVLFLDEPTIGLDPQTRSHVWAHLLELRRAHGITIFMTTHYMDEAERCDRVAIIDHGEIVALATPDELRRRIGGDVVTLGTADNERAGREIRERFGLEVLSRNGHLRLEVPEGQLFVARLARELSMPVDSVAVRRPSLDDVFQKLTGRGIREEAADALSGPRMEVRRMSG